MRTQLLAVACMAALSSTSALAAIVWQQDFSSSTSVADYVGTGTNKIKSVGSYGTGSATIDSGSLLLTLPAQSTAGTAGFLISPVGTGGTVKFTADITWTKDAVSVSSPYGNIFFGKFDDPTHTYTTYGHTSRVFTSAEFRRTGSNMSIVGSNFAWGATRHLEVFMNDTAGATTYEVGTSTYNLSANSSSVWVDGTIYRNNVAANDYYHVNGSVANPVLNSVLFQAGSHTTQATQIRIDNIQISDSFVVPEPTSIALAGVSGVIFLHRRRQAI